MATGNIRGSKRNYARPTPVSTASVASSDDNAFLTYTFTASTSGVGPETTSYLVTGTSTTGTTVTAVITTSGSTAGSFTGGATYAVTISPQNYNGPGIATTASTSILIPNPYSLLSTHNASTTVTLANNVTKIGAVLVGAGGGGAGGGGYYTPTGTSGAPGGAGAGGGIVIFKEVSVTGGSTVGISIGAAGNGGTPGDQNAVNSGAGNQGGSTTITYDGTTLGTATGGGGGSGSTQVSHSMIAGNFGTAGSGSSNVAGAITASGGAAAITFPVNTSNFASNNVTALFPTTNLARGGTAGVFGDGANSQPAGTNFPGYGGGAGNGGSNPSRTGGHGSVGGAGRVYLYVR